MGQRLTLKNDNGQIELLMDLLGAIAIVENPVHHGHTKHIDIYYHYI